MRTRIWEGGGAIFRWVRGREPVLLVVLLAIAVSTLGFILIADEVSEGDTQAFDKWAIRSMRQAEDPATPVGPPWLHEVGRDATAFGGIAMLTLITVVVAGFLWLDGKSRTAGFLVVAVLGGLMISSGLKFLVDRPRPDIVPHLSIVMTSSFPSGHSMLSAVVYLTLGSLVAAVLPRMSLRIYVMSVAVFMTTMVGISRVYLGVHYPTDVLAAGSLVWFGHCFVG